MALLTLAKKEVVVVYVLDQVAPSPSVVTAGVLFVSISYLVCPSKDRVRKLNDLHEPVVAGEYQGKVS